MSALRYRALDFALQHQIAPDALLRAGSRWGAGDRERKEARGGVEGQEERLKGLLERMSTGEVAEVPEKANEQHYELPEAFFGLVLGDRRKYSGCLFETETTTLAQAEEAMLSLSCRRAQVEDGMKILELGCGWGSLTLWLGERYPNAQITAVSNSHGQRGYIEAEAERRGITNLNIITADVNDFTPPDPGSYDRVMSIEMFEHMRNWKELLRRVSTWLNPEGKCWIHVFTHRDHPYLFEGTWAAERFFTAGLMPSHELFSFFQDDLVLADRWVVPGTHYARTLQEWLKRLDADPEKALAILGEGRTHAEAKTLLGGWRLFLLSTDELWGYKGGDHWLVSHYLFENRAT